MEDNIRLNVLEEKISSFDEYVLHSDSQEATRFIVVVPQGLEDEWYYKEAEMFAEHIRKKMNTEYVEVLIDPFKISNKPYGAIARELDCIIFLNQHPDPDVHTFIKNYIMKCVNEEFVFGEKTRYRKLELYTKPEYLKPFS